MSWKGLPTLCLEISKTKLLKDKIVKTNSWKTHSWKSTPERKTHEKQIHGKQNSEDKLWGKSCERQINEKKLIRWTTFNFSFVFVYNFFFFFKFTSFENPNKIENPTYKYTSQYCKKKSLQRFWRGRSIKQSLKIS